MSLWIKSFGHHKDYLLLSRGDPNDGRVGDYNLDTWFVCRVSYEKIIHGKNLPYFSSARTSVQLYILRPWGDLLSVAIFQMERFLANCKSFLSDKSVMISLRKQRFFLALRRWGRFARSETSLSGRRARRNRCFRRLVIYMLNDNLQNELERLAFPFCRCQ